MAEKNPTQKQMWQEAERKSFDLCHTFNEIMTGPNPLTEDEIRKLLEKRPLLRAWIGRNAT